MLLNQKGIKLLTSTERIFTETADGTVVAVAKKLIKNGIILTIKMFCYVSQVMD